jgi:hypothetical protein
MMNFTPGRLLIVFSTSDETSLGITGGRKFRSVISGMALFAIQLARLVLVSLGLSTTAKIDIDEFIITIHEMLNVRISLLLYIFLMTWTQLGNNTYHHPGAGVNGIIFSR